MNTMKYTPSYIQRGSFSGIGAFSYASPSAKPDDVSLLAISKEIMQSSKNKNKINNNSAVLQQHSSSSTASPSNITASVRNYNTNTNNNNNSNFGMMRNADGQFNILRR